MCSESLFFFRRRFQCLYFFTSSARKQLVYTGEDILSELASAMVKTHHLVMEDLPGLHIPSAIDMCRRGLSPGPNLTEICGILQFPSLSVVAIFLILGGDAQSSSLEKVHETVSST